MENKEYKDLKELIELSDEAETLSEDEEYHCGNMSVKELMTKTEDRPYYILLQRKDEYVKEDLYIYVDRHDYLLYKRPEWREWRNNRNAERCTIIENGVVKRCMKDCSSCKYSRNGKPTSLDKIKEEKNYEPESDSRNGEELALFNSAINLLWDVIRSHATPKQYERIIKHYKDNISFKDIGSADGVSKQAVSNSVKEYLASLKDFFTEEEKLFLFKTLTKR